ncbi:hypothetical protein C8Q74DRAFT_1394931 [Fomes fomentarius]|nr:hypothetical protein C8Q74DRAFT_1394931 [Fomes fomentarius]
MSQHPWRHHSVWRGHTHRPSRREGAQTQDTRPRPLGDHGALPRRISSHNSSPILRSAHPRPRSTRLSLVGCMNASSNRHTTGTVPLVPCASRRRSKL